MELSKLSDDRDRLARTILTVALGIVAISSLRKGKRLSGALAGAGAVALGYQATAGSGDAMESLDIASTGDEEDLLCANCGQPIVPGQARGPNADNEIVHYDCKESAE